MVKRILNFFSREISGLHEAAYVLAGFTFLAQLLAVVRDRLLASTFGASSIVDIYYAAFRIPDLLFVLVTSFISASVLVPFLAQHLQNKEYTKKMINSLFSVFLLSAIAICIVIFIFTPQIMNVLMPGIVEAGDHDASLLILFTRILLLSPLLLGISQMFGSIVQAYKKFFVYAITPVLYNVGIICGIVFFYPIFGPVGLIYGVVLSLILHVAVQFPTVIGSGLAPRLISPRKIDWPTVREIILVSLPRTLTLASTQILLLVLVAVASALTVGSIAIFNFSYNLQSVPLSIIGVSYSLAAFPTLSRLFAEGRREDFVAQLVTAARHIIFWSFPVIIMFIVLRAQIVRTILGAGQFDWSDTRLTAAALAIFSVSVLAQSLVLLFVRGYYSSGQTKKPLAINIFSMLVSLGLTFALVWIFQANSSFKYFFEDLLRVDGLTGTVVLMLPLAFSVGLILNAVLLWVSFERDFRGFSRALQRTFFQSLTASLIAGYVAYIFLEIFDDIFDLQTLRGVFSQGFLAGIIGLMVGFICLLLLRNREVVEICRAFHHKFWKTARQIVVDQEEITS